MQVWRRSRWANPAAWYTFVGMGVLALTMWVPWWSADRTARIEGRADHLAQVLLQVVQSRVGAIDDDQLESLVARFFLAAGAASVFVNDLERVEPPPPGALLLLTNKHYAIQLCEAPPDANLAFARDAAPSYEVTAWPLATVGPAHSVFFLPDNAPRAYSRNLGENGFVGLNDERPSPGAGHRPRGIGPSTQYFYRAKDDKRWILY